MEGGKKEAHKQLVISAQLKTQRFIDMGGKWGWFENCPPHIRVGRGGGVSGFKVNKKRCTRGDFFFSLLLSISIVKDTPSFLFTPANFEDEFETFSSDKAGCLLHR